jgi:hypothetical protein
MKTIFIFLVGAFVTAAIATGYDPVLITGTSMQAASIRNSSVSNEVTGSGNIAQQNIASNTGGVVISGNSVQMVMANGSYMRNEVSGSDTWLVKTFHLI